MYPRNTVEYLVWGEYALFSDPVTRAGGEKLSYQIPTYQALKGITESIYWKPSFIWIIDEVRVMNRIRTESKGVRPIKAAGGNSLSFYTYLRGAAYQVRAHFEWNMHRPEMADDRIGSKHYNIARRMIERGGRRDIFLGTRECQGYVEPCEFGSGAGYYDGCHMDFGIQFHGFNYPDETGVNELSVRLWRAGMTDGRISFPRPEECSAVRRLRPMGKKPFSPDTASGGVV